MRFPVAAYLLFLPIVACGDPTASEGTPVVSASDTESTPTAPGAAPATPPAATPGASEPAPGASDSGPGVPNGSVPSGGNAGMGALVPTGAAGSSPVAPTTDATGTGDIPPTAGAAGTGGAPLGLGGGDGAGAAGGDSGGTGPGGGAAGDDGLGVGGALGGMGGTGGAPSPASEFELFRFECPCLPGPENHSGDGNCNVSPETDRQTIVKSMGGDPNTVYDVTFRVRGLSEPNTYVGGTLQGERFYIGGSTSAAGYTSYMMTVADPPEHYFFNYNPTVGHVHFALDYEVTVPIRGGSQVTFDVNGDGSIPDGHSVANFDEMVIPDVPPAPEWYDGQFVQFDVVSVEETQ